MIRAALWLALAGCTLFEDKIPDRSCTTDADCFRAQGEHCDLEIKECVDEAEPDAATATATETETDGPP